LLDETITKQKTMKMDYNE